MSFGKSHFGVEAFGSPASTSPALESSTPVTGSVVARTARQLCIRVAADEGVGVDDENMVVTINGATIYTGGSWLGVYTTSYTYMDETGALIVVVNRATDWNNGTRYNVLLFLRDNNGEGD